MSFPKQQQHRRKKETRTITNKGKEPTNSNFANVQNWRMGKMQNSWLAKKLKPNKRKKACLLYNKKKLYPNFVTINWLILVQLNWTFWVEGSLKGCECGWREAPHKQLNRVFGWAYHISNLVLSITAAIRDTVWLFIE